MGTFARDAFSIGTAAVLLAGCGGNAAGVIAPPQTDAGNVLPYQHTFYYTGDEQLFKVPAGVRTIAVVARGAAGAGFYDPVCFGRGGRVYAIIPVKPGEVLHVFVGGRGSTTGGFNGGGNPGTSASMGGGFGGGGASDVREGGAALKDRILIAGGGGGMGEGVPLTHFPPNGCGGNGGGLIGGAGGSSPSLGGDAGGGGAGGTQERGGLGGAGGSPPYPGSPGDQGRLHSAGNGGNGGYNPSPSGLNDGGGGGGGGGGYYGGGGGGGGAGASFDVYGEPGGGGGGGSSYVERRATSVHMWQGWHRARTNGLVVFSWR